MTANIRILRQVEVEPPPAFSHAIHPDLLTRLRLTPVPVLFKRQPEARRDTWRGFCPYVDYTEFGEVVLDARLAETAEWEARDDEIQRVYLHEVAHRLMPNCWHNAAFGAMTLVLYLRVGITNELPLWQRSKLYDFGDEANHLPRAFAWAWALANELAPSEHTAERCAEIIARRHKEWLAWLQDEPERLQARHKAVEATKDKIRSLQESRWWWALGALILGALGTTVLFLR